MYRSYYSLVKKPFQLSTDPKFLWLGEKHKEALATLKYGVIDQKGFLLVSGDVGTGKTTLINALLESIEEDTLVANISANPKEERNLRDPVYQTRLAKAIKRGVEQFFAASPPPGTLLAERQNKATKHVIARGDTLSEIASRYQVSLVSLRRENRIRSDNLIRIGQVLVIPDS